MIRRSPQGAHLSSRKHAGGLIFGLIRLRSPTFISIKSMQWCSSRTLTVFGELLSQLLKSEGRRFDPAPGHKLLVERMQPLSWQDQLPRYPHLPRLTGALRDSYPAADGLDADQAAEVRLPARSASPLVGGPPRAGVMSRSRAVRRLRWPFNCRRLAPRRADRTPSRGSRPGAKVRLVRLQRLLHSRSQLGQVSITLRRTITREKSQRGHRPVKMLRRHSRRR